MRLVPIFIACCMSLFVNIANAEQSLAQKIVSGTVCYVEFTTFKGNPPDCHGTLARGIAYTLTYDLDTGLYRGVGYVCNAGKNQDHPDPGPHSSSGMFAIFGAKFRFDEAGNVYYPDDAGRKNPMGNIKC